MKEIEEDESLIELMWIYISLRFWKIGDFFRTLFLYYLRSFQFFLADTKLLSFFSSPYRVLRLYRQTSGKDTGPYGETPFWTLEKITEKFHISKEWTWVDLGCGRGRGLVWLCYIQKQKRCVGIELVEEWCRTLYSLHIPNIYILHGDMEEYLSVVIQNIETTILYLYLSSLSDEKCIALGKKFSNYPGLHILSVSFSFQEYGFSHIEIVDSGTFSFPWGKAEVYYQKVEKQPVSI